MNYNTKQCDKCGEIKFLSADNYHKKKDNKDGFRNTCKICRKTIQYRYYQNNKNTLVENKREHFKSNREEVNRRNRERYANNREKISARRKELRKNNQVKSKDQSYEKSRAYYLENAEKLKSYARNYKRTPKGKLSETLSRHKRRARIKKTADTFSAEDWGECLNYFNGSCCYCGERADVLHQDHFIPVKLGGEYTEQNIVPACQYCNSRKHAKLFSEWYTSYEHYDVQREKAILSYLGYKNDIQQLSIF